MSQALTDGTHTRPTRRWFRFSLRTLFVVVTVVCAWLAFSLNWIQNRRDAREWILAHGGTLLEKEGWTKDGKPVAIPPAPFGLNVFGETGVQWIWFQDGITLDHPDAARIFRLFPEAGFTVHERHPETHEPSSK